MRKSRFLQLMLVWLVGAQLAVPASAINVNIDYTYDTGGFFPVGSQAYQSLEAAASFFSTILDDTFSPINVPAQYYSTALGSTGVVTWSWDQVFQNPTTGAQVTLTNPPIAANQYKIYAGARGHAGITAGVGGPGGFSWESDISGTNSFTPSDITNINNTTASFEDAVERRGESSGFARWGGAISFDTSGRTWNFDHTTAPSGAVTDFYSVAIHELAHALGFGEKDANVSNVTPWEFHISGSSFFGSNATLEYGGSVPLHAADLAHWASGTTSTIQGTATSQEAAMDPEITQGTRKRFTDLDAAAMKDIGWTVVPPPAPPGVLGDYNNNGIADAADYVVWRRSLGQSVTIPNDMTPGSVVAGDYTVWRSHYGQTSGGGSGGRAVPEPGCWLLVLLGATGLSAARRKRRG